MKQTPLFDVVQVAGPDALVFLHSQFAADLNSVADGALRWTAWLNAQGRVLHVIGVWRLAVDRFALLVPFQRGAELVDALQRFVLRRKLKLQLDDTACVCANAAGTASGISGLNLLLEDNASATNVVGEDFIDAFVEQGLALIDANASGRHLAHALRLDRFAAFSVNKGCYPGQEIIARTHFLGRNKRVLVALRCADDNRLQVGENVFQDDTEIGEIACVGTRLALAVLVVAVTEPTRLVAGLHRSVVTVATTFTDPC